MKAKIKSAVETDWYKDFVGQTFEVTDSEALFVTIHKKANLELLTQLGLKLSETTILRVKKSDITVFDSYGIKVEPCKFCKKLTRKDYCNDCESARVAIMYVKNLPGGEQILKRLVGA